jgi:hypothetical protein
VDDDWYIVKKLETMGRPRTICHEDCLGLLLTWNLTHGSMMVLQLIFGMMMAPLAKYLQFGRGIIMKLFLS